MAFMQPVFVTVLNAGGGGICQGGALGRGVGIGGGGGRQVHGKHGHGEEREV